MSERVKTALYGAYVRQVDDLLHSLSVSMASFIAEFDNSNDVARYVEQRLAPLKALARTDVRFRNALEAMAKDSRTIPEETE